MLICLFVGGLVPQLALPLLWVAQALATRIRYRRHIIKGTFTVSGAAALVLGLISMIRSREAISLSGWISSTLPWAQLACGMMLVLVLANVAKALVRQEPPQSR